MQDFREETSFKKFLKNNFLNKNLLKIRLTILFFVFVIVFTLSFSMLLWCLKQTNSNPFYSGFISIEIIGNSGLGFSFLKGNPAAIYTLQFFIILLMLFFVFSFKDKIVITFLLFIVCGGLFNFIQRMIPWEFNNEKYINCVLDYLKFEFMNFPVFNFPDVFAVCGTFGFVISYIAINIKKYLDEKREKKIKNE